MRFLLATLFAVFLFAAHSPLARATADIPQGDMLRLQEMITSLHTTVLQLQQTVENQNEVIRQQVIRIDALETGVPGRQVSASSVSKSGPVKLGGISQGFNPEIGVVGTAQAYLTEDSEDEEGKDALSLKELEVSFAHYVDPYSRLDAIIAFNDAIEDQNVEIEEAYYSHWGLPFDFTGRLGKFRSKIGKQNLTHLHQLDTADYPLVIQNFFGEHGLSASGVRLQNHIPNPWDIPLTLTGEVLRGNEGESFSGVSRRPIFNTHLGSFFQVTDSVELELGSNWMVGDENVQGVDRGGDRFGVHIFGFDKTLKWHMDEGREAKWQSELYLQRRSDIIEMNDKPWGFYSLLDYRFSPKWSTGIRFDYVEPLGMASDHRAGTAISPYLTFWQSEFAKFRVQYQHLEPSDSGRDTDDAIYLQAHFMIGSHSHPVQ